MAQLHYSDQEARRALADLDPDRFAANIQGEGYGVLGDDKDRSFNSPPPMYSEPPIEVHHQIKDPLTAGKPSPDVSAGYEPFEAKPEDGGEVFPPAPGYGNVEGKQDDAVRAVPPSGYGGQPDKVTKLKDVEAVRAVPPSGYGGQPELKDVEGYTSLGIEESQGSENSTGVLSEEGNSSVKERVGTAPYESMAKELEDYPAGGGGIADVPPLKKDPVDFLEGDTDDRRGREAAPQGWLRNAERQQEDKEGGFQGSFGNAPREQEERGAGAPQEALGVNKDESVEREGGVPHQAAMAEEPEGGSATGSRGIIDLQSLKGDHVDISETSSQEPNVIDDSMERDRKDEPKAVDPVSEAGHADTSHFTTQIKSPVDDPKQRYAVDDPIQELSVDDTKQEFSRPDFSKQDDFHELSKEPRTDDPKKEEVSIRDPKPECPVDLQQGDSLDNLNQEDSLDDVKKSPVDPIHEDSIAGPTRATDEMGEREAAPQAGLLGNAEQQEDQREGNPQRSFEKIHEQEERDFTPLGALETSKDEHREREDAAPDQSAFAEEREGGSDVQSLKEDHVDLSEASPKEPNSADDPIGGNSTDEPIPRQAAIAAEEPQGGSAPGSRGIIDVDSSEASTKKPNLVEDSIMEGNSTKEPTPHQSAMAEEPEGDSAPGSRGILDVQSLKEDYGDLSGADTKESIPANDSREGSITNEPTPHQSAMAEEPEGGPATESRGVMDVQSLKEDHVDPSEASTKKEPNVADDFLGGNSQSAMAEEPEGVGSVEGSGGIIDVQSMKEDYVEMSQAATNEPNFLDEAIEGTSTNEPKVDDCIPYLKDDGLKQKSAVDECDHEESNASPTPASPLDDSNAVHDSTLESSTVDDRELELAEVAKTEQSKQPQATDDDIHGCERFQGDDGKEKTKAEGYNIFLGEPENKVNDAADVIGDEHVKPTHGTEADVAVEPFKDSSVKGKALPEAPGNMEDAPEKVSGFDIQENEQARDFDTSKEHEEPFKEHVNSAVEQDAGYKLDVKDVNIEDASSGDNAVNLPAEEAGRKFSVDDREQEDLAEVEKPESALDDGKQSKEVQASPTDDACGGEHLQGDDGKEKIKAEGYNIYSGETESAVYGAGDVIGDEHEKPKHETEADVAITPYEEDLNTRSEALTEALRNMKEVPKESGLDIQGNEQARDFDIREEHDGHEEAFTQHVSSAAVEQDVGLKLDDRDVNTADVSTRGEAENVPADKKALEFPAADLEQDDSADAAKPEFVLDDAKQPKQAEAFPTGDDIDGSEHFQGDDGREKSKAQGYNIYSGEPEKKVYDVADVIGDQHEKLPHETEETKADAAMKPCEDGETKDKAEPGVGEMEDVLKKVGGFDRNEQARDLDTSKEYDEHVEPATQHISPEMEQDAGFKPDARDMDTDIASMREDVPADMKSPYTDVFTIESSDIQQSLGLEPNLKNREEYSPAAINKEVDAADRENGESGPVGEEFPNTEFAHTNDYVKVGHGAEGSVPRQNEELDGKLRAPSERVEQPEERRPTDEHPLNKPQELDSKVEEPKRPPVLPHPQPEDLTDAMNNKTGGIGDDGQQHHEAGPEKKGIFTKIKEKMESH